MDRRIRPCSCVVALLAWCASPHAVAQALNTSDSLTLPDALAIALQQSPALEAFALETRAAEARVLQAGLRPNPELELELETIRLWDGPDVETRMFDAPGALTGREIEDGADSGWSNDAEITLVLSQAIELGGKRAKRVLAGERAADVATWDYEVARADVLSAVAKAFIEAFAAQVNVGYAEDALQLANEVHKAIAARVEAGSNSPIDASRARLEVTTAEIDLETARRASAAARATLAAAMGLSEADFGVLAGDIEALPPVPPLAELERATDNSPDLQRWQAEIAHRESRLRLQRANRWPDLTVGAGWRAAKRDDGNSRAFDAPGALTGSARSSADDGYEHTFLLKFSLPIPLFDRNQGNIREAEYLISKAAAEHRATKLEITSALRAAWQRLSAGEVRVNRLRDDLVPNAEEVFASTNEGYRAGKFSYLDVLDAQRTFFDTQTRLAAAYADFYTALVDVERLAGSIVDLGAMNLDQK